MSLEGPKQHPKDPMVAIQGPLALLADGLSVDETDRTKRGQAMQHWLEHGAADFRKFADAHPDELPDPSDLDGMKDLLEKIHSVH